MTMDLTFLYLRTLVGPMGRADTIFIKIGDFAYFPGVFEGFSFFLPSVRRSVRTLIPGRYSKNFLSKQKDWFYESWIAENSLE